MKKLFSALLISLIVFTLVTLPASATANDVKKDNISIQTTNSIEYKGLWYEENYYLIDWHSNAVTPDKNAKLNIWLENDNDVRLYVYETNIWGFYSKIYKVSIFNAMSKKKQCNYFRNYIAFKIIHCIIIENLLNCCRILYIFICNNPYFYIPTSFKHIL